MSRVSAFAAIVLLAIPQLLWAAAPSAESGDTVTLGLLPSVESISQSLQPTIDRHELSGAVALVAKEGKILHLGGVGLADITNNRPMAADTIFSIMSMTKPIASVAALMLCDEGKLSLDEPIKKRLPEFDKPQLDKITLRHLITHTSGVVGDQRNVGSLADTVSMLAGKKLHHEPGSQWLYSPGITVAGGLVEVVSGQPFEQFLAERIFQPLGMHDTTFKPNAEQLQRLASVYAYDSRDKQLHEGNTTFLGALETRSPNPSGGLYSTASDLFRFYQMLLNGGELEGARILKPETVAEMIRPQTGELKAGFVPGSAWGLGVGVVREPQGVTAMLSPGTFGHGGMLGTQSWADPQKKAIYIVLVQRLGLAGGDGAEYRRAFQQAAADLINRAE
jgi:CubicO group peptidase (beta-lactamase class C family)